MDKLKGWQDAISQMTDTTTNTPEPVATIHSPFNACMFKERCIATQSALQAERERAEKLENEATADAWILSDLVSKLTEAEAELAALEVKTWNAAIEAAAEGFELDDGHYYDQVRESILRLKK